MQVQFHIKPAGLLNKQKIYIVLNAKSQLEIGRVNMPLPGERASFQRTCKSHSVFEAAPD